MFLAKSKSGELLRPCNGIYAVCPICLSQVIPKIGQIMPAYWSHKSNNKCKYGCGMTEWHYRWMLRHHDKKGWQIEYIDGEFRYDCFNKEKSLVLEFQKASIYDYFINKSNHVFEKGLSINWVLHNEMLSGVENHGDHFKCTSRRRSAFIEAIDYFSKQKYTDRIDFYVDMYAKSSKGNNSKGLLRLISSIKHLGTINYGHQKVYFEPV